MVRTCVTSFLLAWVNVSRPSCWGFDNLDLGVVCSYVYVGWTRQVLAVVGRLKLFFVVVGWDLFKMSVLCALLAYVSPDACCFCVSTAAAYECQFRCSHVQKICAVACWCCSWWVMLCVGIATVDAVLCCCCVKSAVSVVKCRDVGDVIVVKCRDVGIVIVVRCRDVGDVIVGSIGGKLVAT